MSLSRQLSRHAPLDVTVCALLIAACGLIFLITSVIRLAPLGVGAMVLPIVLSVLELGCSAAVLAGVRLLRPVVLIVLVLGALLHLLIVMDGGLHWPEVVSAILAAGHVYALVLMITKPMREHFGVAPR
jgi:hypothetical protein